MGSKLGRHSDLVLAILIVASVAILVVPLPTVLVDILLAANIGVAVCLLLVGTYVSHPLRLSTLPSILLLATLFRLALNVSTTRLILSQADAGRVVDSFGDVVVGGSVMVGAVMFAILIVIQFVVVARGSERVAEVAARFALDALPGRQAAIDAQVATGQLGPDGAARQRAELHRESQMYGAMDGAMKFVKGDAIAGLIITVVNIAAGLAIGVMQQGMAVGDAVGLYSRLTVGDGLVAQIPSMLVATTAGIVVTRVSARRDQPHLAHSIGSELARYPRAIAITGGLMLVFALVPGLPLVPFLALAVALGLISWQLKKHSASTTEGPRSRLALAVGPNVPPAVREAVVSGLEGRAALWGVDIERVGVVDQHALGDHCALLVDGLQVATPWPGSPDLNPLYDELEALLPELIGVQNTQRRVDRLADSQGVLVQAALPTPQDTARLSRTLRALVRSGVPARNLAAVLEVFALPETRDLDDTTLVERVRRGLRREITHHVQRASDGLDAYLVDPIIEDAVRAGVGQRGAFELPPHITADLVAAIRTALTPGGAPVVVTATALRPAMERLARIAHERVVVLGVDELLPHLEIRSLGMIGPTSPDTHAP